MTMDEKLVLAVAFVHHNGCPKEVAKAHWKFKQQYPDGFFETPSSPIPPIVSEPEVGKIVFLPGNESFSGGQAKITRISHYHGKLYISVSSRKRSVVEWGPIKNRQKELSTKFNIADDRRLSFAGRVPL